MTSLVRIGTHVLAWLALGSHIVFVALLIIALVSLQQRERMMRVFGTHAVSLSFIVALVATLGSLFYSDIAGFEPCKLCWYQRIVMYPQVILFGVALWKRRNDLADYSLALSGIGALIAGYHYLLQRGVVSAAPCSAVGYSVSCSKVFTMSFGYITIPLMAFTAFALLFALQMVNKRHKEGLQ